MEKKLLSIALALCVVIGVFAFLTDGTFLEARNLSNLLRQTAINGILAVGMTWVILLGGVDLSVGSMTALCGIVVALLQTKFPWALGTMGVFWSLAIVLCLGILLGAFNGMWIAGLGIHSFVITFGMMVMARGLAMIVSNGQSISPVSPELNSIGAGYLHPSWSAVLIGLFVILRLGLFIRKSQLAKRAGIPSSKTKFIFNMLSVSVIGALLMAISLSYEGLPYPVLISACVILMGDFILKRTRLGRYIYAVGSNAEAARLSGVPVQKIIFTVFVVMGLLSALAGVVLSARLNGATPTAGQLFELDAIAAVVIGGTSLKGGRGTVFGSLLGALIIESLNNGMSLMNVPTFYQMPLKGAVVILAVAIDSFVEKQRD